jgi:hypothetical protein
MTALLTLRLPLSTDLGNPNSSTRRSRAPKPVTLARPGQQFFEIHLVLGKSFFCFPLGAQHSIGKLATRDFCESP